MPQTKINIIDHAHTIVTRPSGGGEWDCDDTSTSHYIEGIVKSETEYGELQVPYKVKPGTTYYLVYVIYSTGDSFHSEEGVICFIDLYQNRKHAEKTVRMIQSDYDVWKHNEKDFSVSILDNTGKKCKMHCPWKGFFEGLTYATIDTVQLVQ